MSAANAKNQYTTTSYSQTAGGGFGTWPVSVTDANGQTASSTYDALGRMTSETLPGETAGDSTTSWSYTTWCAPTGAQTPCLELDQTQRVDSSHTLTTRAFYDGAGRLVETRTPGPGGQDVITYAEYDAAGRQTKRSVPYFVAAYTGAPGAAALAAPDRTQHGTTTAYTLNGQASELGTVVTDALSHVTTTYRLCESGYWGDSGGYEVTFVHDANGHQTGAARDGLGRVDYSTTYTGTNPNPYTLYAKTTYGYDYTGHLVTTVRPDGKSISVSYDAAGRQTGMSDPDRGTESYVYDPNGNVTTTVDARGASGTISAGYDGLNRQVWRNTSNSPTGAYVSYSYDTAANGIGRLASESFSNANAGGSLSGSYTYTYDPRGQVTASSETVGGVLYTTGATYNDAGQLLSQTYPNQDVLTTSYDPSSGWQDQLSVQLGGVGAPVNLLTNESYSGASGAMGLLTGATLGGFTGGSGSYSASYDTLGRLTSGGYSYTPTGGAASTLYQVQPTYDALSTVIENVTTLPQGVDTQVFCYDDLARLTWAGSNGTPACSGAPTPSDTGSLSGSGAQYSATYAYDVMNRLTSSPLGGYSYGDSAHADAATAIGSNWTGSYDAAGNLLCRAPSSATTCAGASPTGAQLGYDNQGQLASWQNTPSSPTSTDRFLYDGEGNRVEQVAASGATTTTTTYIGGLEELATTGATTTTTAYYGGLALSVNGALSYTLSDSLGSVSAAVGANGTSIVTQLYGPYGAVRYSSGTLPGTRAYTGQRADAATGLDYYGARYYDPLAGQFASADTVSAGGLNRYAYVGGSPETRTDPSGHLFTVNSNPDYTDTHGVDHYAQAMYQLFAQDGTAANGAPLAAYMALNDSQAYAAADSWAEAHGEVGAPNVGRDSYLYIGAKGNAYWNSNATTMSEFVRLDAFKAQFAMQQTGSGYRGSGIASLYSGLYGENPLVAEFARDNLARSARGASSATASGGCGLSFAADTPVATPEGERPIATLKVGDHVLAVDSTTGQRTTQTIVRVYLNHDHDRLDVTLALPASQVASATIAAQTEHARDAETAREQARRVAGHGLRAPPDAAITAPRLTGITGPTEVIHTTANHPWLSADHGWLLAGDLRVGEPVRLLDGGTAWVVALQALPGVGPMWDLSLDSVHTFAVGDVQAVVHNCPVGGDVPQAVATNDELSQGAHAITNHGPYVKNYSSDYQWEYKYAEGPSQVRNATAPGHDPAYSMRYTFHFDDLGNDSPAIVSANFDPVTRDWEAGQFHFDTRDTWHEW